MRGLSVLHGLTFSAVSFFVLTVWSDCGKACGAAEKPAVVKVHTDRVRGGR
jgi:hypothetical protein